ncbi:MAG: helix-turn-helix transcriptional regulator, partial [Pseudomonadota bacterium]
MSSFGARYGALVRKYRTADGFSTSELALRALGDAAKRSRISEIENGKVANPRAETIAAINDVLGIDIEEVEALRADPTPRPVPAVEGVPTLLLESLARRFQADHPGGTDSALLKFLEAKGEEYLKLKTEIEALKSTTARMSKVLSEAQALLDEGDFAAAKALILSPIELQKDRMREDATLLADMHALAARADLLEGNTEEAEAAFRASADAMMGVDRDAAAHRLRDGFKALYQNGLALGGDGLHRALSLTDIALTIWTRGIAPENWAMLQNDLAVLCAKIGERGQDTSWLTRAIAAYEAALEVHTRDALPADWAMTQNNLGEAYRNLAMRQEGQVAIDTLPRAIAALEAALEVCTRKSLPVDWAGIKNNLGNTYIDLA